MSDFTDNLRAIDILRLIGDVVREKDKEIERLREGWPKLGDELLGHIEATIIEKTGDGPLAAYVVRWLEGK